MLGKIHGVIASYKTMPLVITSISAASLEHVNLTLLQSSHSSLHSLSVLVDVQDDIAIQATIK